MLFRSTMQSVFSSNSSYKLKLKGVHPRLITEGFEIANAKTLELLESFKVTPQIDRPLLIDVSCCLLLSIAQFAVFFSHIYACLEILM